MGPHGYRVRLSRDSGLINKRDTPVKPAVSRRGKCRRLLSSKHYEAFPEEPEVEEMIVPTVKPTNPVLTSIKPVHCQSVLHLNRPVFTENPRDGAITPAAPADEKYGYRVSPAGHPTIQMTPQPEAFKCVEIPVRGEEQNLTVTLESITSSSMESDTTFSSDDDEDEEDCHSASATSSSLPSPEIFRTESYVETFTFPIKEKQLGFHLNIKNSTLLDASHAESIHMHHPPNLSNIIDASSILAEKNCEINKNRGPEAGTRIQTDSFKSEKAFNWKTPSKLTNRRPFLYKKKVWFKSPVVAETELTPAAKLTIHNASEPAHTLSPTVQMKPDADTSTADEINSKEEELRLMVTLKRPVKSSPEKAKFFDFMDDNDRDAFFTRMRERCVKLKSAPLFPLTAPEDTVWPTSKRYGISPRGLYVKYPVKE